MGFLMGASAGAAVGLMYGSFTALSFGPAPGKTYLSTIASYMIQHGSMLGFFLSIGSLLRNDYDPVTGFESPSPCTLHWMESKMDARWMHLSDERSKVSSSNGFVPPVTAERRSRSLLL